MSWLALVSVGSLGATNLDESPPANYPDLSSSLSGMSTTLVCPTGGAPQVTVLLDGSGNATIDATIVDPAFTGTATLTPVVGTPTKLMYGCGDLGTVNADYMISYGAGSSGPAMCGFILFIDDTQNPVFSSCLPDDNLTLGGTCTVTLPDYTTAAAALASDNCGVTITQSPSATTVLSGVSTVPVTMTATDGAGNTATCTFDVILEDNSPPVVTCPGAQTLQTGAGSASCEVALPDYTGATVTDNCSSGLTASQSPASGALVAVGTPVTVTLSATDASGNTGSCTFVVTAEDNTDPVANCVAGPLTVQLDAMGNGTLTAAQVNDGSTDNCGIASLAISKTTYTCADIANNPITVTLTVTDDAGNTATCDVDVNVEDDVDPDAMCKPFTATLDASGNVTIVPADVDDNSSDNCGIVTYALSRTAFTCADVGSNTVTLTVTDAAGNTDDCDATVTVQDVTVPDAQCQDLTLQLDASGMASIGSTGGTPLNGITGSFTTSSPTFARPQFPTFSGQQTTCTGVVPASSHYYQQYAFTITTAGMYSFTMDRIGGGDPFLLLYDGPFDPSAACTNFLAGNDDAVFPNSQIDITLSMVPGNYTLVATGFFNFDEFDYILGVTPPAGVVLPGLSVPDTDDGSTDACGIASYTLSRTDFTCVDIGTVAVTMTVTDVNGNSSTCISNVLIEDNIDPVADCAAPFSVTLDANGAYTLTAAEVDGNSTDNCGAPTLSIMPSALTCANVGTPVTVTLTAADASGNSTTCTTTVTVLDATAPDALCQNVVVNLDPITGLGSIVADDFDGGSTDACGPLSFSATQTSFDCTDVGVVSVDLTVSDGSGNSDMCTAMVTVNDITPPVVSGCPAPKASPTDPDAYLYQGDTYAFELVTNPGECLFDLQYTPPTASDVCSGPIAPAVGALVSIDAVDQFGNTIAVTQNFDGLGNNTSDRAEFPLGVSTVTYTFSDASGNPSTCIFTVFVEDLVPPTFVQVNNSSVNNDLGMCGAVVTFQQPVAIDNCPGVIQSQTDNTGLTSGDFFPVGTTTLEYTATDAGGLMATVTINVVVIDAEAPVFTSTQATINQNTDLDLCSAVVTFPMPMASDNCPGVVVTQTDLTGLSSGSIFPLGTTTLEFTATDGAGLTAVQTFDVVVTDVQAPEALCQAVTVQLDANGDGSVTAAQVDNGSNDACGIQSLVLDVTDFTCVDVGANTVTLTVTDNNGNVSMCTATVTVEDNVAPTALCQDVTVQLDAMGNGSITAAQVDNGSNDACGIASITVSETDFTCTDVGANTVTLTVEDVNGNVSTCTAIVTVEDNIVPTAICQDVTVQLDANGVGTLTAAQVDNGSNAACGIASTSIDVTSFDCTNVGLNTVTLTVTDNNGNVSTCTSTVTVEDDIAPTAVCQDITLQLDANGQATIPSTSTGITSSNAVSGTWSATDAQNSQSCNVPAGQMDQPTDLIEVTVDQAGTYTFNVTAQWVVSSTGNGDVNVTKLCEGPPLDITANLCDQVLNNPNYSILGTGSGGSVGPAAYTLVATLTANSTYSLAMIGASNATGSYSITASGPGTATFSGGGSIPSTDNGSSDACGIASYTLSQTVFTCADIGIIPVTMTVTDVNGNVSTCISNVTIEDVIAPTASCQDITVQLDTDGDVSILASQVDNGSSDNCGTVTLAVSPSDFTCVNLGANTVTLTVTDGSGLMSTCTAVVTVEDVTPPVLTCPSPQFVDADGSCEGFVPDYTGLPGLVVASDNCSVTLSQSPAAGTALTLDVAQSITITATDGSMNAVSCSFDVTLQDVTPPTFTYCPPAVINLTNDPSDCDRDFFFIRPEAVDNCTGTVPTGSAVTYSATTDNGTNISLNANATEDFGSFPVGTTVVTYTADDGNGNTATCVFSVVVTDISLPTLGGLPPMIAVNNDPGNCSAVVALPSVFPNDNCGVASVTNDAPAGNLYPVGTTVLTFTVTDVSGNSAMFSTNVVVTDAEDPIVTQAASSLDQTVGSDAGVCGAIVALVDPTSTDNCAVVSTTNDAPATFPVGSTNVTYTVSDMAGNTATFVAVITVNDVEAPMITQAATSLDQAVSTDPGLCTATVTLVDPSATDNCAVTSITNDAPAAFPVGTTTVTWTVSDMAGNTAMFTADITVTETEAPMITQAAGSLDQPGVTTDLGVCGATVALVDPSATDNCGIASIMNDAPALFPVGTTTVTWTVSDMAGNTATFTADITVTDNEAPAISQVLGSLDQPTVTTDAGVCGATVTLVAPAATDNCGIVTTVNDAPALFPVGLTTVTWTLTDAAGNPSTFTVDVTVTDEEDPTALCQPVTIQLDASGNASVTAAMVDNGSSDACGIASLVLDRTTFTCTDEGSNTVTMTVTDVNGNVSTCTSTVTVEDNVDPTALCQNVTVQLDASGTASVTAGMVDAGSTDNCTVSTVTVSPSTFDCSNLGANTVTLTVTDQAGNMSTCTAIVTVEDLIAPVITCSGNQTVDADASCTGVMPDYTLLPGLVSATDNCTATLSQDIPAGTVLALNVAQMVTVTATDAAGNTDECTFSVTLTDVTAPVITCSADITGLTNDPGACDRDFFFTPPTVMDNCEGISPSPVSVTVTTDNGTNITQGVVFGNNSGDFGSFPVGVTTVTYTATDAALNSASCSFTVTVIDDIAPTIVNVPADISVGSDLGLCGANVSWSDVTASDNCLGVSLTSTNISGDFFPVGTTTVTYTAVDAGGLTTVESFVVSVMDTEAPVVSCPANVTITVAAGQTQGFVSIPLPVTSDNCNVATVVNDENLGPDASGVYLVGTTTVTFTVVDDAGLSSTCSFDVVVNSALANDLLVSPRMMLEGALIGSNTPGLMRDDLRNLDIIPSLEPYNNNGETVALSVLTTTGPDAIVDWVEVELRQATVGAPILATRSALLQRDGDVVDVDGTSPVSFVAQADGPYFISVKHRNHLGAMAALPVSLSSAAAVVVDFTSTSTQTFGASAQKMVGSQMALKVGDATGDGFTAYMSGVAGGVTINSDYSQIFFDVLLAPGNSTFDLTFSRNGEYLDSDVNMDGEVSLTANGNSTSGQSDSQTLFFSVLFDQLNTTFTLLFITPEQLP